MVITKVADSEHVLTKVDAVAPTCTTSGTAEYYTCSHCDKIFADANANKETESPVTIDALGHDTDGVNWTAEGDVHYKACRHCGAHIDEAAHSGGTASCEAKAVCEVCGAEYGEYDAHTLVKTDRVEPTCIENGTEAYWTCSACGKLFSDENGTTEISAPVVIPATGEHEYVGEWQKNETGHWKVCECGALSEVEAHVPDKDAPTETEGVVCTVCGYEIQPAAGHVHAPADQWSSDESYHWHACEGCTQQLDKDVHVFADKHDENGHWKECTVCGKKIEESEHDWDEGVVTTKPTLTTEGEKTCTCACGETKVEKLAAQASFADDFTLEKGQPGPWSYGSIDYKWGPQEDFTFTQATSKNDGDDGWAAEGEHAI